MYQPLQGDEKLAAATWFRLLYRQQWLPELQTMIKLASCKACRTTWINAWAARNGWLYRGGSQGLDIFRPDEFTHQNCNAQCQNSLLLLCLINPFPLVVRYFPQALNRLSQLHV
ncbi:hypothetical protein ALON55S_06731 [Alishewanella longhuensis]